jgi:hypothetical protein
MNIVSQTLAIGRRSKQWMDGRRAGVAGQHRNAAIGPPRQGAAVEDMASATLVDVQSHLATPHVLPSGRDRTEQSRTRLHPLSYLSSQSVYPSFTAMSHPVPDGNVTATGRRKRAAEACTFCRRRKVGRHT